jgi:hypothetical protein
MKLQRRSLRFVAMAVVVSLPLLGMSGWPRPRRPRAKGCHKTHTCKSGGGGTTGSGTGADPAPITVQIDPNPLVETGQSDVLAIVQVETSPSFAGDPVTSPRRSCNRRARGHAGFAGFGAAGHDRHGHPRRRRERHRVLYGDDCAPGPSVVEADLAVAPYYTALATLDALPPVVTTPGVTGYPTDERHGDRRRGGDR